MPPANTTKLTDEQRHRAESCIKLAVHAVNICKNRWSDWMTFDDACSYAYFYLCRAARSWKAGWISPRTGQAVEFSTYAMNTILNEFRSPKLTADLAIIRVPVYVLAEESQLRWEAKKGRVEVESTRLRINLLSSFGVDRDAADFCDNLMPALTEEDRVVEDERHEGDLRLVAECLGLLNPSTRQEDVLRRRFGLPPYDGAGHVPTLEATAAAYGVTKERVRQIEYEALERIRAALGVKRTATKRGRTKGEDARGDDQSVQHSPYVRAW